jgi:hypothetical protein
MEQNVNSFLSRLANLMQTNANNMELRMKEYEHIIEAKMEQALEKVVQEIHEITDTAVQDIATQSQQTQSEFPNHGTKCSTLFPNVDPELYTTKMPPRTNPYGSDTRNHTNDGQNKQHTPHLAQSTTLELPQLSDEEWMRFGPKGNEGNEPEQRPLPPLNAYKMLNQVKVPYIPAGSHPTPGTTHFTQPSNNKGYSLSPLSNSRRTKAFVPESTMGQ